MEDWAVDNNSLYGARWISCNKTEYIAEFKKTFFVSAPIKTASLLICGLGFFDCLANEQKIDDAYFKPVMTDYSSRDVATEPQIVDGVKKRVVFTKYDISHFLRFGENELRIFLGNGYYQNDDRLEEPFRAFYGDKKLIFALNIECENGDTTHIVSDTSVLCRETNAKSGLYIDNRVDFSAANRPFENAVYAQSPDGEYVFCDCPNDKICKVLPPVDVIKTAHSSIYDFGENHSGGVRLIVKGQKGQKIKIGHAETLYEDGSLNYETSRFEEFDAKTKKLLKRIDQVSEYTLSGGEDKIEPLFSWFCYRYIEIVGAEDAEIKDVHSLFIHTDVENNGQFDCSEKIFCEIERATRLTLLDNMHCGLMTDCPHREKRPYTGDGALIAESSMYLLQNKKVLSKWLDDIIGAQREDGFVPYTAPHLGGGGGYSWGNVLFVLPRVLYQFTGNKAYIEKALPSVKKLVSYYTTRYQSGKVLPPDGQTWCLGDWLAPEITDFNVSFMNTLCYYKAAEAAEEFAGIVGETDNKEKYTRLKEEIAKTINENFLDEKTGNYCSGKQGENVLPLAYKITPKEIECKTKEQVSERYDKVLNRHLDTGIVSTPILIDYLTDNGMEDLAFDIMTQRDYPSYAYMLDGETTLCEHWSKRWPDYKIGDSSEIVKGGGQLSHCHPMFGSVVSWIYKRVAGIDLSKLPTGEILFNPIFKDKMAFAKASVTTVYGQAAIEWKKEDSKFYATVIVPPKAKGRLQINCQKVLIDGKNLHKEYTPENSNYIEAVLPQGEYTIKEI